MHLIILCYYLKAMNINIFERLKKGFVAENVKVLQQVGMELSQYLPQSVTIALSGDLGAGKTTFVGGLAKGWGIDAIVTSPTFTLFNIYEGCRRLIHMDAYRLNTPEAVLNLGIESFCISPYAFVIEWPEKLGVYLPDDALHLSLSVVAGGRQLIMQSEY